MAYTPEDIIWIKHVTNTDGGPYSYMDVGDEFVLHVPTKNKSTALSPPIGELVIVFQRVHGIHSFTHLVTPIDDELIVEDRDRFKYGRRVKVIAFTNVEGAIVRNLTAWRNVKFQGIGQGNFCRIANTKDIQNLPALQQEIWDAFAPFMLATNNSQTDWPEIDVDLNSDDAETKEGKLILQKHWRAERDRKIVQLKKAEAIRNGQLHCECCEFSFQTKFQKDFIECHHIVPIGSKGERKTKLEDLALVCPNCHRMLHLKFEGKYLSIDELRNRFYPQ